MPAVRTALALVAVLLSAAAGASIPKPRNVEIITCDPGIAVVVTDAKTGAEVSRAMADKNGGALLKDLLPGHRYYVYLSDPGPYPTEVPKVLLIDPSQPQPRVVQCESSLPNYTVRHHPVTFVLTGRSGKPLRHAQVWAYRFPGTPTWTVHGETDSRGWVTLRVLTGETWCVVGVLYKRRLMFQRVKIPPGSPRTKAAGGPGVKSAPAVEVEFDEVE